MKKTALLLAFFLGSIANAQIPSLSNTTYRGQSDASGNQWGDLTINLRTPVPNALQGAPFSAKEERKSEQLLADGTRITQPPPPPTIVARDAQGRTRVERIMGTTLTIPGRAPMIPLVMVEINDVVEGYLYILDPAKKIAYRTKYQPVEPRSIPLKAPTVSSSTIPKGAPGTPAMTVEPLGTEILQGVQADGRRTTMVFPVGSRGNDQPITEVQEVWIAPSLQVTLLSTSKSPTGNNSIELTNLSTLNPTPEQFRPPQGYDIRDQPATFTVEFGKRPNATPGTPR